MWKVILTICVALPTIAGGLWAVPRIKDAIVGGVCWFNDLITAIRQWIDLTPPMTQMIRAYVEAGGAKFFAEMRELKTQLMPPGQPCIMDRMVQLEQAHRTIDEDNKKQLSSINTLRTEMVNARLIRRLEPNDPCPPPNPSKP